MEKEAGNLTVGAGDAPGWGVLCVMIRSDVRTYVHEKSSILGRGSRGGFVTDYSKDIVETSVRARGAAPLGTQERDGAWSGSRVLRSSGGS